jgi:hypothetical protein
MAMVTQGQRHWLTSLHSPLWPQPLCADQLSSDEPWAAHL